jgi:integral membrane protein (TIGR01906 family)
MRPVLGLASILVSVATAVAVLAIVIVPFLTPAWVSFEQGRADAAAWTGYTPSQLQAATNGILHDLVLGPPQFNVEVGGTAVLTPPERAHMRDVRDVFSGFYLLAAVSLMGLVAAWGLAGRSGSWTRARFWRGIRRGALGLSAGVAVAGVVALVAFDAAFELFHSLFFAAGSYDFDPRVFRLTQLFPDAFWSETTLVVGAAALVAGLALAGLATRRIDRPEGVAVASLAGAGR